MVSRGGDNELGECLLWGEVVEGGAGAVARFVGDGTRVGLVAGDGGAFGQVAAHEAVGVLVRAPFPRAVGVGEEHVDPGGGGQALVAGHFAPLVPGRLFWVCPGSFPGGDMMMARPRGVSWAWKIYPHDPGRSEPS